MFVKPKINMQEFLKDWREGMSAPNLQKKYIITPRQYRWLKDRIESRSKPQRKATGTRRIAKSYDFNEPYITLRDGKFLLRKGKVYFGQYNTFEEAKYVKERLKDNDWDKDKLDGIRSEINIAPLRSYNYDK
jgi:hypothetical protein